MLAKPCSCIPALAARNQFQPILPALIVAPTKAEKSLTFSASFPRKNAATRKKCKVKTSNIYQYHEQPDWAVFLYA